MRGRFVVCRTWRKPSVLLFGAADPFIELKSVFEFLDTKRTNMKAVTASAKLGHMPQEVRRAGAGRLGITIGFWCIGIVIGL